MCLAELDLRGGVHREMSVCKAREYWEAESWGRASLVKATGSVFCDVAEVSSLIQKDEETPGMRVKSL